MVRLPNRALGGSILACCYNPSIVRYEGRTFVFFRLAPERAKPCTYIGMIELDADLRPVGEPRRVQLPGVTDRIIAFEDPRAFVWREKIWLLHVQAAYSPTSGWSAATVLAELGPDGEVSSFNVPMIGRNRNYAVADAASAIDRNWSPLVVDDDLYIVYEIHPLMIFKYRPQLATWELACNIPWNTEYRTRISGGTPLVPWMNSEYIGLFHTYQPLADGASRHYSMAFYCVDVTNWRVSRMMNTPVLDAWNNFFLDTRPGFVQRLVRRQEHSLQSRVVFPSGIVDQGRHWAVSFGWNDCRSYVERYSKADIERAMSIVPWHSQEEPPPR
jgi:predicted GH43/DUF377 family glycosyl hydrolase